MSSLRQRIDMIISSLTVDDSALEKALASGHAVNWGEFVTRQQNNMIGLAQIVKDLELRDAVGF